MNTLYIKNWPEIKAIANLYGHYAKKDADFLCPSASNLPRFLTDIISRRANSLLFTDMASRQTNNVGKQFT